jgi:nucleoid-associated protein YgaU
MFDNNDRESDSYYTDAVKDAVINNTNSKKTNNKIFLILNLSFLGIISYFVYNYLQNSDTDTVQKTKVMGVTHIAKEDTPAPKGDIDYAAEIEKLDTPSTDTEYSSQLVEYVDKEIKKASTHHKRVTTEEEVSDLADNLRGSKKDRWRELSIIVKKGDTLGTLAEKYYGDPTAYEKIIQNNSELTAKEHVIYPGQELKILQKQ